MLKAITRDEGNQRAADMLASFTPIQARWSEGATALLRQLPIQAKLGPPRFSALRQDKTLGFVLQNPTVTERLGEADAQFPGQMIITGPCPAQSLFSSDCPRDRTGGRGATR